MYHYFPIIDLWIIPNTLSGTRDFHWKKGFAFENQREMGRLYVRIPRNLLYKNNVCFPLNKVNIYMIYLVKQNQPLKKVV